MTLTHRLDNVVNRMLTAIHASMSAQQASTMGMFPAGTASSSTRAENLSLIHIFFDAAKAGAPAPIDVYDAAAWMSISCLSEQSVAMGGAPVPIPDFTNGMWMERAPWQP